MAHLGRITPVNRTDEIIDRICKTFDIRDDSERVERIDRSFVGTKDNPILDPIKKWVDANVCSATATTVTPAN